MASLADLVALGKDIGIFQFFLPFILTFAIIYGLLQRTKIFGGQDDQMARRINAVVALAFSAFILVATPAGPAAIELSSFLANFAQGTLLVVLSLLVFLVILVMLVVPTGGEEQLKKIGSDVKWIAVAAVILAVGVFLSSGGTSIFPGLQLGGGSFGGPIIPSLNSQDLAIIVVVVLTGLAIVYATKGGGEASAGKSKKEKE